jgi:hypothetical protein
MFLLYHLFIFQIAALSWQQEHIGSSSVLWSNHFFSHVKINKKRPLGFQTALCSHLESKKGSFNLTQPHFSNTWFFAGILLEKKSFFQNKNKISVII